MKNTIFYSVFLVLIGCFGALGVSLAHAADLQFTDTFSSSSKIDLNYSSVKISEGRISNRDDSLSSRVESKNVERESHDITRARITTSGYTPSGSQIIFYVSNNSGQTWNQVAIGQWVDLPADGRGLRWAAVIVRSSYSDTPYIDSITIDYQLGGIDLKNSNDDKRISRINSLASRINSYYRSNGSYPVVSGSTAETRWRQLGEILMFKNREGKSFISKMPEPIPSIGGYVIYYDYDDLGGDGYVLSVTLEDSTHKKLSTDIDGMQGSINCDDPVFCRLGGAAEDRAQESQEIIEDLEDHQKRLIRAEGDSRVYYITDTDYRRHIPNEESFNSYHFRWRDVVVVPVTILDDYPITQYITLEGDSSGTVYKTINQIKYPVSQDRIAGLNIRSEEISAVSQTEFDSYRTISRLSLVRGEGDPRVYYITNKSYKRHIPSPEVFLSYGNKWENIVTVPLEALNQYPEDRYIYLEKETPRQVFLVFGNEKRYVPPWLLSQMNVSDDEIAPVNIHEFNFYALGSPLQ